MSQKKVELTRVLDRLNRHYQCLGFVADHVEDQDASMSICAVQDDLKKSIKMIKEYLRQ